MATISPVEYAGEHLAALLDKRDQLLALANSDAKLTHAATGAA
jgi:hypothetical protein